MQFVKRFLATLESVAGADVIRPAWRWFTFTLHAVVNVKYV
jgi:hypothetical protein